MRPASLLLAAAALCAAQQLSDFAGGWVYRDQGRNILKLTLAVAGDRLEGALTQPVQMSIDQDGNISGIGSATRTLPVQKCELKSGRLEMTIDGDSYVMTLDSAGRAALGLDGIRPWKLDRIVEGETVELATSLPDPEYSPEIRALRERLHAMVKEDQDARFAFDMPRMEAADARHRPEILGIFEKYSWPPASLIGKDGADDFWLLVQHQTPQIQQLFLPAMEKAAQQGQASMSKYTMLYDRVQMGLGKPQHFGNGVVCENGKPVLYRVDDPVGLEQRRKDLFLMPLDEYLTDEYMVKSCAALEPSAFAGAWILKFAGRNLFKLTLAADGGRITGSLTGPKEYSTSDGDFSAISEAHITEAVQKAALESGRLELTIDGDRYVMTLDGAGGAILSAGARNNWKLERAPAGADITLATRLFPAENVPLVERLRAMAKEDQDARLSFDEARIAAVDRKYRGEVQRIFEKYGWVKWSVAGVEGAHLFWLLVQHQAPPMQRLLLPEMEKAVHAQDASMKDYTLLYDRVQQGLGKPQHWGNATRCENGKPVLYPVDDPAGLDQRREELDLIPMAEYLATDYMVKGCAAMR